MVAKKHTQRLLQVLAEERASHGHGAAAEIDERLERAEGYLGRVLRGEVGLQVEMLFKILEVLGSDPADFFARVVGAQRVNPELLLARLERQSAPVADPHLERVEALLRVEFKGQDVGDDLGYLHERLTKIDNLRFSKPKEARKEAVKALAEVISLTEETPTLSHLELLCSALGESASIDRIHTRFTTAARALRLALYLTRNHQLTSSHAQLLQRTCYLIGDQGEYGLAIELARQASDLYLQLDDRIGIGKSLVDQGIMLCHFGKNSGALQAYQRSLSYLPKSAWKSRFSVFQGIGQIYASQNNFEEARRACAEAMQIHRTQEGQNWWRLLWLQGEIELRQNLLKSAEEKLSSVRKSFIHHGNPFDIALVSLMLAKALFLLGRSHDVQALAAQMISLLKPLRKHKVASASIHEFARAALMGTVTVTLLDSIHLRIKGEASTRVDQELL